MHAADAAEASWPADESGGGLSDRARGSLLVRAATRCVQLTCLFYSAFLLYWIWLAKDLRARRCCVHDPVFDTLLAARHALRAARASCSRRSTGRRPTPATGRRVSIVIPAFNEEDVIAATIDACFASRLPARQARGRRRRRRVERRHLGADAGGPRAPPVASCASSSRTNRGKRAAMAEGIRRSTRRDLRRSSTPTR